MGNYIDYGSCSHCRCLAYMSYNQSIKNRNKTQVELIANSVIKSLAGAIENDENSSQLIPDTGKQINVSKMECSVPYGTVSNIKINRKKENLIIASLKANYHDEDYTIYAYLTQSNNQWKCVQYDTNGNRDISTDSSSSGNDSGNNVVQIMIMTIILVCQKEVI